MVAEHQSPLCDPHFAAVTLKCHKTLWLGWEREVSELALPGGRTRRDSSGRAEKEKDNKHNSLQNEPGNLNPKLREELQHSEGPQSQRSHQSHCTLRLTLEISVAECRTSTSKMSRDS